jgi:hypothetical protein
MADKGMPSHQRPSRMTTIQEALVSELKNRLDEGRRTPTKAAITRDSALNILLSLLPANVE